MMNMRPLLNGMRTLFWENSMAPEIDKTIYQRPVELLQNLIRFDTSNPPGNERECVMYIGDLLNAAGIETRILFKDSNRPNLVARLVGKGSGKSPLLIYGHVDVVSADSGKWTYPPFSGEIADGFVWGRGALDMKGAVAMMVSAFMKAKIEGAEAPGDVILCILSDEEEYGEFGAHFLVESYPELFKGVRYALSEFGGFTLYVGGKKFYPIEIAQKQKCVLKAVLRGPSGHGSGLMQGGVMVKLAKMLDCLDKNLLPVHVTPVVEKMFKAMADVLPFPNRLILRQLLNPRLTHFILNVLGEKGKAFVPMFHNTVNATIVRGGNKVNVIPGEVEVQFDVRILPGFEPDDVIKELRPIIGPDVELDVAVYDKGPAEPDMGLFDTLAGIIKESDPEGIPIPLILTGSSDARFFSRLGIQTYGFTPMKLPENMNFNRTIHSVDERIPVDTLEFGANALYHTMYSS
jgi:acetylornithine deacetylase/succinyl-diaminopimelate desuccinylase-like protein